MRALAAASKGASGAVKRTDAIASPAAERQAHAYRFDGERYDCGSAAGFVIANLAMALGRSDVAPAIERFIEQL